MNDQRKNGVLGKMVDMSVNTKYNTVRSTEKSRFPFTAVLGALIVTVLFMFIVFSFMQISQIKADMAEMNATMRSLRAEEKKLTTELEGKYSAMIDSAVEDMGFSGEGADGIRIGERTRADVTSIIAPEEEPSTINTLMSALSRSFRKFVEFLE